MKSVICVIILTICLFSFGNSAPMGKERDTKEDLAGKMNRLQLLIYSYVLEKRQSTKFDHSATHYIDNDLDERC